MNSTEQVRVGGHEATDMQNDEDKNILNRFVSVFGLTIMWSLIMAMTAGGLGAAVWTALPTELAGWGSSTPNYMGYVSHCPFTPYGTVILIVPGVIGLVLIWSIKKRRDIALGVLAGLGLGTVMGSVRGITGLAGLDLFIGMGMGVGFSILFGILIGMLRKGVE